MLCIDLRAQPRLVPSRPQFDTSPAAFVGAAVARSPRSIDTGQVAVQHRKPAAIQPINQSRHLRDPELIHHLTAADVGAEPRPPELHPLHGEDATPLSRAGSDSADHPGGYLATASDPSSAPGRRPSRPCRRRWPASTRSSEGHPPPPYPEFLGTPPESGNKGNIGILWAFYPINSMR